jgi:hypothetical protein
MLESDYLDNLAKPLLDLHEEYVTSIIQDMARRLSKMGMSQATAWQMERLQESGAVYQNAIKELSRLTGKTENELRAMFEKAGVKTLRFDDKIHKEAGVDIPALALSPAMEQVLQAGLQKTAGAMTNLTKTTAISAQQAFIKNADLAYMQVSSGAMSYDQAIRAAIKQTAVDGLDVIDYATGAKSQLDVAMRRTVLTGVGQTANQLQLNRMDEAGTNLIAVSAHIGARNHGVGPTNHASWQGRIYSRVGGTKKYPNFAQVTGYGTGEGLGGWNCRHSFYPFYEGISENAYSKQDVKDFNNAKRTVDGEKVSTYDATQKQRYIERQIRLWKRQEQALEAAKLTHVQETAKVSQWQAAMREFIRQSKLNRQYVREQV